MCFAGLQTTIIQSYCMSNRQFFKRFNSKLFIVSFYLDGVIVSLFTLYPETKNNRILFTNNTL